MDEWLLEISICAPVRKEHWFISKLLEAQQAVKQQMEEEVFLSSKKKGQMCPSWQRCPVTQITS